ncbi:TIGR04282 family arsenosugar biosynthesis glycosyltransferase [Shimia thalassica]|uniref:TIGR04282 family arsenosugar biosynthesis glycosyltransferase n=1 Tax=Shimia thalassica TaxID=1715693 RepID=UPI0026E3E94B|nr:TIGR04282 family arsenosugar biosynthesis glycosyltransferase [Shimia thalassica]MDO6523031.1 TIGR04282 family arsenosugar biosynthesis glycosyltransferase [Shimia thalassica]
MSYRPRLVVMIKVPRPGRVKTRLGRDIGMTTAAWWFRHQSQSLIRRLTNPRWDLILAVAPDHAGMNSRIWSPDIPRIPQGSGDLGDRMSRIFRELPPGPVCIIGADIPGIQTNHIAEAFRALGDNDAVFGPAFDGGYWLTGLKRTAPVPATLFDNVRWSTEHALTDSIETLRGQRIAQISKLRDVDTVADLPFA